MNRKAIWLLVLCITVASISLLLPSTHAERSAGVIPTRALSTRPAGLQVSNRPTSSDLVTGTWLAATNAMPMTALAPFIDLQEAGLTTSVDGVGLLTWDHTTPQTLNVNTGGVVRFALLYWAGQDDPCPAAGAACDPPVQPYKDQQIVFNGTPITGTIIGTETSTSITPTKVNNIGYFADVTSIVSAAGAGPHSFTFADGNGMSNLASLKGASLVVAFTNAADPKSYRLIVWDNLDYAFSGDPTPGDPRTTAAVNFNHGTNTSPRTAALTLITGDGEVAKADEVTISNNSAVSNLLNSSDDADGWDTDTVSVTLPAGVGTTTVQINSPAGAGAEEFLWQASMLRVPMFESVEPTCTTTVMAGPPKQVQFSIQDTGSGLASIVVTQSENADTVVPPFIPGTTEPVIVTSTKIDQSQPMRISMTVTDVDGNQHVCTYDDSCLITCPANITVSNDSNQCGAVVNYPAPTTSGTCGTVTCSPASGSFFPKGTTTVTCTSTVGPSCSFTVTVNDTQPPTITCPANITQSNDSNQCGAVVNYPAPTQSDNCPGVSTVCSPASGSFFPKGTTTVTCTATDAVNNTATCSFTVTVNDTQPPTITCPANVSVIAQPNDPGTTVTYPPPTAADNCPGVTTACVPASGSAFPVGTTTVTCTATDLSSNTATCSFNVAVQCTSDGSFNNTSPLVISRFRENGPGGGEFTFSLQTDQSAGKGSDSFVPIFASPQQDEFVEIFNPSNSPHTVSSGTCSGGIGVFASAGNGTTSNAVSLVCEIPNGTVIPARGYFLCTGAGYTLGNLGRNGGASTAEGDALIGCGGNCLADIPNDAGLALINVGTNTVINTAGGFAATNVPAGALIVYDKVGFSPYGAGAPAPGYPSLAVNFCEGACLKPVGDASNLPTCANPSGYFPVVAIPPACYGQSGQYEILRRQTVFNSSAGTLHQDTNSNTGDFLMVSPNPGINVGLNVTGVAGVKPVLGAAAPHDSTAPADLPTTILTRTPFDVGPQTGPRNAERIYALDPTVADPNNDPQGTYALRFKYTNSSLNPIDGLRFSMDDLSTMCGPQAGLETGTAEARNLAPVPDCQNANTFSAILKVLNSTAETVVDSTLTARGVAGTVIEDTSAAGSPTPAPGPLSPLGGGIDASLVLNHTSAPASVGDGVNGGTGSFNTGMGPGSSIRVKVKFGVVRNGRFIILVVPMGKITP